jgi:hypothetical protein
MKPNRRIIGISAGVVIAIIAAWIGFLRGYFTQDICTGTGSAGYQFARVCGDGFLNHVGLFAIVSLGLLLGLIALAARQTPRPIIRLAALGVFLVYAVWVTLFSSSVWTTPYFVGYVYDPARGGSFDLNCPTCRIPTATPIA